MRTKKIRYKLFIILSLAIILSTVCLMIFHERIITPTNKDGRIDPYISITYGIPNNSNMTGSELEFYSYNLVTNKLKKECHVPFNAQYGVGVINKYNDTLYYSNRSDSKNLSSYDNICSYNIKNKEAITLENYNSTYNDIAIISKNKLLVTARSQISTAIMPALFDLNENKFTYYNKVNNEEEDLYSTRTTFINYNFMYKSFINVYVNFEDFYDEEYRMGNKTLDHNISLVNKNLKKDANANWVIPLTNEYDITLATQISQDKVIIKIDNLFENTYKYYTLESVSGKNTVNETDKMFPDYMNISNCITLDDGKSYYVSGRYETGVDQHKSGLFHYDCETNVITDIILNDENDDVTKEGHVINFFVVEGE